MGNRVDSKVVIIGAGFVGSTFAYSLMLRKLVREIVLVDSNKEKAIGEAMDINHSISFTGPTYVSAGDYSDCKDAHIVCITAGANQKPGETRLDLLKKNAIIMKSIIEEIKDYIDNSILLIASNPVDVLTYLSLKYSGLPVNRVMGSGTTLDTARFKYLISKHCNVDPRNVHGYIIGEHGDSEIAVWSSVNISGIPIDYYCKEICTGTCKNCYKGTIFEDVKNAAYEIIKRKQATYYAIATSLVRITEAIIKNQNTILPLSILINDIYGVNDVCLSLPVIVNADGYSTILKLPLTDEEKEGFTNSARIIKENILKLEPKNCI